MYTVHSLFFITLYQNLFFFISLLIQRHKLTFLQITQLKHIELIYMQIHIHIDQITAMYTFNDS